MAIFPHFLIRRIHFEPYWKKKIFSNKCKFVFVHASKICTLTVDDSVKWPKQNNANALKQNKKKHCAKKRSNAKKNCDVIYGWHFSALFM